ncbi:MAG: Crp/Fnr family transcriptional regulator [Melioribacteraceae bacterium]|jgi:CRP-like cAMP-binding protein|nr:Crp/Fnr family transcriptional regulator [Melioribacteraceae bacterium]
MNSENLLNNIPLFEDISEETLNKIVSYGNKIMFKKDSTILVESEEGTALFFIIKGKVKVTLQSKEGKEVILSILKENDFFGEMALIDGTNRAATIVACEPTELFIIKRDDFLNLLKTYPEISISLLQEISKRLRFADLMIKSLSLNDAEGKVAVVLNQYAFDYGKIKNGVVEIDKAPTQQDIAKMAGTSRETVNRVLGTFSKKGMIEIEGSIIRIMNYEEFTQLYL